MSNGKRKPTGAGHAFDQGDRQRPDPRRAAHTPARGASPFDAPTMYQPHSGAHTAPQSPFDAPTMMHPGTGQHDASALAQTPATPGQSPFDAPTMFQHPHQTSPPQPRPSTQGNSPFDAPTMYQPNTGEAVAYPHAATPHTDSNEPWQGYPYPGPQNTAELELPQEEDLYTGGIPYEQAQAPASYPPQDPYAQQEYQHQADPYAQAPHASWHGQAPPQADPYAHQQADPYAHQGSYSDPADDGAGLLYQEPQQAHGQAQEWGQEAYEQPQAQSYGQDQGYYQEQSYQQGQSYHQDQSHYGQEQGQHYQHQQDYGHHQGDQSYHQEQSYDPHAAQGYAQGHAPQDYQAQAQSYGQDQGHYQDQNYQQDQGYGQEQAHYEYGQNYDQGHYQEQSPHYDQSYGHSDPGYGHNPQAPHYQDEYGQHFAPQASVGQGYAQEDAQVQGAHYDQAYADAAYGQEGYADHGNIAQEADPWAAYNAAQAASYDGSAQAASYQAPDAYHNPYAQAPPAQPAWQQPPEQGPAEPPLDVIVGQSVALDTPPPTPAEVREVAQRPPRQNTPPEVEPGPAPPTDNLVARLREALGDGDAGPATDAAPAWRSGAVFQEGAVVLDPVTVSELEQKIAHEVQELLATTPPEAIPMAELVWQQMAQALKKMALYLHQQAPKVAGYFVSVMAAIQAFHRHHDDLVVTVQPFDFMWGEASVFTSDSHENSPCYKLYGAGIRTLTIAKGLALEELIAFGQCLALTPQALQEEDIASRLWRADLRHITTLQVQSIEIADEGAENIEDLAQLVAMLTAQLHTDDPQQAVNFRGIDALDLMAGSALISAETERYFGALPALPRRDESALWHQIRATEEGDLATYGCQLYSCLFQHLGNQQFGGQSQGVNVSNVSEMFAHHLIPLCDHLFLDKDFYHMAVLLDALEWQSSQLQDAISDQWKALLSQLSNRMSSPENVALLLAHLREVPQLTRDQEDALGVYLHFLGADVQRALIDALPTLNPRVRRLLLEVMSTAPRARGLLQAALSQLHDHEQVLLDLLHVAGSHSRSLPRGSLRMLLRHKSQMVQTKAFLLLAQDNPDEAREVADTLLLQANPEARKSIVKILCQQNEDGVFLVLSFAHSESFAKLSAAEQLALYAQLGQTKEPAVLDACVASLGHKSQLLKPQVDRNKRLAIAALKASQTPDARRQLELALKSDLHSKKMRAEIADALKTMWT